MVLAGHHLVARTAMALAAPEQSALVDRLIDTTEQIVLVVLGSLPVAVVLSWGVSSLGLLHHWSFNDDCLGLGFPILLVLNLIDDLTGLEALGSDPLHFLLGDG